MLRILLAPKLRLGMPFLKLRLESSGVSDAADSEGHAGGMVFIAEVTGGKSLSRSGASGRHSQAELGNERRLGLSGTIRVTCRPLFVRVLITNIP
jgi:hypothetical protein